MRRTGLIMFVILGMTVVGCGKDQDEDGYKGDDDCDDLNAAVNPKADETCDGVDNNCNGKIDEGLILEWFADKDNDQYGDLATMVAACVQPAGYVDNSLDCDDASEAFHPMAQEDDCEDPNDYNCDGSVGYADEDGDGIPACGDCDDSDAEVSAPSLWYVDYDGDGFGSDAITITVCAPDQEDRWAENADDCDDLRDAVNPEAIEVCNELDDNCDDTIDEFVTSVFYEDADGDGYGTDASTTDACSVPEGYAVTSDDCDDALDYVNPGAEEICNDGLDNNCSGGGGQCIVDPEEADLVLWGSATSDHAGDSVGGGGDMNGDGYDDFVVGAYFESTAASQAGAAYVIYGGEAETIIGEMSLDEADVVLTGEVEQDKAGRAVNIVPDLDGDGSADLLVAAPAADMPGWSAAGKLYVVFGGSGSGSLADADVTFSGQNTGNYAGLGQAVGDFNDDGEDDLLVGASGNDRGCPNCGTVYAVWGPISAGDIPAAGVLDYITGQENEDQIGNGGVKTLDQNGDGLDDVLIGAPKNSEGGTGSGSVYVVHGPWSGAVSLDSADLQYTGESSADRFGSSISGAGDLDGDGNDDFIAGAAFDDATGLDAGAAYIIYGGAASGGPVDEHASVKLTGEAAEDSFGAQVVGNGDINNDGENDLVVSAPYSGGTYDTGSVYVFYGPFSGSISAVEADVRLDGDTLSDHFGNSLAFAGDVDGDGNSALLIGAAKKDTTGTDAGGAYLMLDIGL
jgi:hypothetical protein